MKSLKKVGLILGASTLFLAACGGGNGNGNGEEATPDYDDGGLPWDDELNGYAIEEEILNGSETLTIWVDNDDLGEALIEAWNEIHPNSVVEFENVGAIDARERMALDGPAGLGADVFMIAHDHLVPAMDDLLVGPFGRYTEQMEELYIPGAFGTVLKDGQAWAVPLTTESLALFYNRTLLEEITGSSEPSTSWEEIIELAEEYNNSSANQWTIRWEAGNAYTNFMFSSAFGWRLFGPNGDDPTAIGFDSEEMKQGLEFLQTLRPIWDVNADDANWDTTVLAFSEGTTPYLITGPWAIPYVTEGAEANDFEFGVTTLPTIEGNDPITFSGHKLAAVSSRSEFPGAARAFAMFMGSLRGGEVFYEVTQQLPALQEDILYEIPGITENEHIVGIVEQAQTAIPMPSIPEIQMFWAPAATMYSNVWNGLLSVEEAQARAMEDFQALQ